MGLDIFHVKPIHSSEQEFIYEFFSMEDLIEYPSYIEKYKHWFAPSPDKEHTTSDVLYHKNVGYQRKGMTAGFISDFENNKPYLTLNDVIYARSFLDRHENDFEEKEKNFKENFIDNFVEGESIFFISW